MEYALGLVFKQNGAGSLIGFEGELPGGQLSDCTGYANNRLESYFDQENIREIFSRDAVSWLNGIKNRNSQEILKLFSYAYYYEFGGRVNLFNNSQHQNLLDTQGDYFQKALIGYNADPVKYNNDGYSSEQITRIIYGSEITVFIKPEVWLKEHTRTYYSRIINDSSLKNLYSFFKIVMKNGLFMDEIEDSMAMELSGFAWDYLNDVAKEEQNDERNIFGKLNELGRHIKSKRESIKKIKNNGGFDGTAKRQKLLDLADKAFQESRRIRQYTDEMTSLMNRGSVTISTILRDIPVITGKTLDSDSEELINQLLQSYTGTFENNSDALGVISQYLKQACSISRDRIGRRESELTEDKNTLLRQMRQSCKTGQLDDYKDLALSLYESPAYKAGESLVLLGDSLLEIPSYSPSGYLNNLNSYGITLAALYKERMEAVKQTGYREMQLDMEDFIQRKENWRTRFQEQLDDGMAQWKRSTERMIGLRERWRQQF